MGTRSYIVAGRGNPDSWTSCSTAPAVATRAPRPRSCSPPTTWPSRWQGKVWLQQRADRLVDEIPAAYKDIDQVMADQADLVEVRHTLHQVLNYKGT